MPVVQTKQDDFNIAFLEVISILSEEDLLRLSRRAKLNHMQNAYLFLQQLLAKHDSENYF